MPLIPNKEVEQLKKGKCPTKAHSVRLNTNVSVLPLLILILRLNLKNQTGNSKRILMFFKRLKAILKPWLTISNQTKINKNADGLMFQVPSVFFYSVYF